MKTLYLKRDLQFRRAAGQSPDQILSPLILELNARPGLNIQIANRTGLLLRLSSVEENYKTFHGVEERVAFAQEHFGAHI